MAYVPTYVEEAPTREAIDARPGLALLEFGANWCGHCQAAQPAIAAALAGYPGLDSTATMPRDRNVVTRLPISVNPSPSPSMLCGQRS